MPPRGEAPQNRVVQELTRSVDPTLVLALVDAYKELTASYEQCRWKPGELEGGHFAEAAYRILEYMTANGTFTPTGQHLVDLPARLRRL